MLLESSPPPFFSVHPCYFTSSEYPEVHILKCLLKMAHSDRFDGLHFSSVTGNKLDLVFIKMKKCVRSDSYSQ